jgi:hypothetical protein
MDFIVAASIQQKNPLPHLNTALTILAQQSETPGRVAQITLKYNQNSMQNVSFSLPPFTWKKTNRNELMYALNECTSAIEIDPNFAPAYLVRAQVKMLLQLDDYCTDIWKARDLGILDAEAQLKAKCK